MKRKVLDLIYSTHSDGREKAIIMKDFLVKHVSDGFCEDVLGTLRFFYKHIPIHFAYEELVIRVLLDNNKLNKEEIAAVNKVMEEHAALKADFEGIRRIVEQLEREKNNEVRESFICLVNDTIYSLIKHAEYEDEHLFPLLETKAGDDLLSVVEKEMAKIVA